MFPLPYGGVSDIIENFLHEFVSSPTFFDIFNYLFISLYIWDILYFVL